MTQGLFNMKGVERAAAPEEHSKATRTKATKTEKAFGRRYERVQEVIGEIRHGEAIHYVSAGEWSMHELQAHILEQIGPAEIWIASWSITQGPMEMLNRAIQRKQITRLHCLFDWRVKMRCPEGLQLAKQQAASLYVTNCHAKTTVIQNAEWQISIVGSANYTNNPRIEAGVITEDAGIAAFHREWIQDTISRSDPFDIDGKHKKSR